ncbi:MAG: WD40 repeat domain-containing protein [Flavobacteriales bacterium]
MEIQLKGSIKTHSQPVYALSEGTMDDCVMTCGSDKYIAQWNIITLTQVEPTIKLELPIYSILLNKENLKLYAGDSSGSIHLICLKKKTEERHITYHQKGIFKLKLNPSNQHLYACGGDGKFTIWNSITMELLRTFQFCDEKIRTISISSDHKYICVGGNDGIAHILETEFYNEIYSSKKFPEAISSSCFSPCGKYLILGFKDAHLAILNRADNYTILRKIPAHYFAIYSIVFSLSGKNFATCSRDKTIKIWDTEKFEVVKRISQPKFAAHTHSVNDLLWLKEDLLISTGDDRQLLVWKINY